MPKLNINLQWRPRRWQHSASRALPLQNPVGARLARTQLLSKPHAAVSLVFPELGEIESMPKTMLHPPPKH